MYIIYKEHKKQKGRVNKITVFKKYCFETSTTYKAETPLVEFPKFCRESNDRKYIGGVKIILLTVSCKPLFNAEVSNQWSFCYDSFKPLYWKKSKLEKSFCK